MLWRPMLLTRRHVMLRPGADNYTSLARVPDLVFVPISGHHHACDDCSAQAVGGSGEMTLVEFCTWTEALYPHDPCHRAALGGCWGQSGKNILETL